MSELDLVLQKLATMHDKLGSVDDGVKDLRLSMAEMQVLHAVTQTRLKEHRANCDKTHESEQKECIRKHTSWNRIIAGVLTTALIGAGAIMVTAIGA